MKFGEVVRIAGRGMILPVWYEEGEDRVRLGEYIRHEGVRYEVIGIENERTSRGLSSRAGLQLFKVKR